MNTSYLHSTPIKRLTQFRIMLNPSIHIKILMGKWDRIYWDKIYKNLLFSNRIRSSLGKHLLKTSSHKLLHSKVIINLAIADRKDINSLAKDQHKFKHLTINWEEHKALGVSIHYLIIIIS